MSQLDLFGNATPVEELDWPPLVRLLAAAEGDLGAPLTDDEAGAIIHAKRGKHGSDARCDFCGQDGREALARLRERRPLDEARGSGTEETSSRLADSLGPASSSGSVQTPRARSTDPETSHDAAMSVQGITELQARIYDLLREHGPMTDVDLIARYRSRHDWPAATDSGIRTRRHELVELRQVVKIGVACERGKGGRAHTLWGLASGRGPVHDPEPEL